VIATRDETVFDISCVSTATRTNSPAISAYGPASPTIATSRSASNCAAPVVRIALASGIIPATSDTVVHDTLWNAWSTETRRHTTIVRAASIPATAGGTRSGGEQDHHPSRRGSTRAEGDGDHYRSGQQRHAEQGELEEPDLDRTGVDRGPRDQHVHRCAGVGEQRTRVSVERRSPEHPSALTDQAGHERSAA